MNIRITKRSLLRWLKRLAGASILAFGLFLLLNLFFPLPDKLEYSLVITDNRDEIIHAYLTGDDKWRMNTGLEEISPLLRKTIVAKEDKYFYRHWGVNPFAVVRALAANITRMKTTSGASTITMQVARLLEPRRRTLGSKIVQMFRAFQLEWKYSKGEILQLYLNLVPYGGNIEGVKAASLLYFGKNPDHLSLAEITALSIIPNRPSSLVIGRDNAHIVNERNRWLKKFAEEKVFTEKEIADALAEPLTASRGTVPRQIPHLAAKLKKQGGWYCRTSIDMNMQWKTEKLVADYIRVQRLRNIRNAAVIILDNTTHQVLTYVGSSGFADTTDGGQVNGAAAVRQPGSTLKPLLFGLCFDEGLLTPKSVIADVAGNYGGYSPENYDRKFNGYVNVEYALAHSLNIPAVKSLQLLGKETLVRKLSACGFEQVRKDQRKLGLSMILGGCGTSLEELTGLFSVFANDGDFYAPSYLFADTNHRAIQILSPPAAFMVNEILSRINRPDFPLSWTATERMPRIAWKTGTSYGRRDAWSIGYNKRYTVGVWVGNFSGVGVPDLSGAEIATPLLFRIFNTIDYDSDTEWFSQPRGLDLRQVCSESGMVPSAHCSKLSSDYFIPLVSSTRACDNMREVAINPDGNISYCNNCAPASGYRKKWFKVIAPEMQSWMAENHIGFEKIPPHYSECEVIFKGGGPQIESPANGSEYLVSRQDPEPLQLRCKTANDVSKVYWYINNKFYKASPAAEKQFFVPEEGSVKISCTDDKGRNRDIRITVKYYD